MFAEFISFLGDVELPGGQGLDSQHQTAGHMQPALIGLAMLSVAVVAFLGFDFYKQKRNERREREKLERFREKRMRQNSPAAAPPEKRD